MNKVLLVLACLAAGATTTAAQTPDVERSNQRSAKHVLAITPPPADQLSVAPAAAVQPRTGRSGSGWRKLVFGAIGGVAGFYGGGVMGATIGGGRCRCDDAAVLKGVMIGAPIGAAVGATLGVVLAR